MLSDVSVAWMSPNGCSMTTSLHPRLRRSEKSAGIVLASLVVTLATVAAGVVSVSTAHAACSPSAQGLGVTRVVEIDATGGAIYGAVTKFEKEANFLRPKEVVLTFDDGPAPAITRSILATLDAHCTKATFFSVGRMAITYPSMVKDVMARGHTVGAHTWTHPMSLGRLRPEVARDEIERGFAAIALAAGRPIAPFFRFPGLGDNQPLLTYLQSRHIATFTVDVISNDSFIASTDRLIKTTLERVEQRQGGIILFHDIKPQTAKALPIILGELHARGYKVVHLRSKHDFVPDAAATASLEPQLAKALAHVGSAGAADTHFDQGASRDAGLPVMTLAPAARPIMIAGRSGGEQRPRNPIVYGNPVPQGSWTTTVRRHKNGAI